MGKSNTNADILSIAKNSRNNVTSRSFYLDSKLNDKSNEKTNLVTKP
jgi:hypothetical protein